MKKNLLQLTLFVLSCTAWAQDVSPTIIESSLGGCYLIRGTGDEWDVSHNWGEPFATLQPTEENGVFQGKVKFGEADGGFRFVITTALVQSGTYNIPDDEEKKEAYERQKRNEESILIADYRYATKYDDRYIYLDGGSKEKDIYREYYYDFLILNYDPNIAYNVTVDFNYMTILIAEEKTNADIDLTNGAHFTVTVNEPGSLKQRLTNAVFQTDEDIVDYLTVKGKLGGADIAYLQAQEGLVSQLQYLDISEVELVYDDEPYFQNGTSSFYSNHTNIFTLSAENKDEQGPYGGLQGQVSVSSTYCRRNDLSHAFEKMQYLKECYLPKTLPAVGEGILRYTRITKVGMPTAPAYIGDNAFYDEGANWVGDNAPSGLLTTIEIPASVERIGEKAFMGQPLQGIDVSHVINFGIGCFARTELRSIQLNDAVEAIPNEMFCDCWQLRSITIPASVTAIGESTFSGCEKLTTVTINEGVKTIGAHAFDGCGRLTDLTLASTIEEIGYRAFNNVPFVENLAGEDGVKYLGKVAYSRDWQTAGAELHIKEGTVSIADNFADNVESLTSITLPSTLRILGANCLRGTGISSIELPEALEKIGIEAFSNVSKLRRITIPKNVRHIGDGAFVYSGLVRVYYNAENASLYNQYGESIERVFPESVTRVIIGEGVKSLPSRLFNDLKNLTRVQMPSTVESIGDYAFSGCTSLESIDLPSSLKHLGRSSLLCGNLSEVSVYMTEPLDLMAFPDEEELKENWKPGQESMTGGASIDGPFASIEYGYSIDAEGNITFGTTSYDSNYNPVFEEGKYSCYNPLPLLRVPNGSLAAYQSDGAWSVLFQQIEQFDGASDTETVGETTTVSVSETVTDDTDLTGALMGGIYVTLDTEDSGDGYNATEGCLVINSTVTEEGLTAATADDADDLTVKNLFNGLIFEVPKGKGTVVTDCQTLGQNVLYVKIGSAEPKEVTTANRQQLTVPYEVDETTRIYVYAAKATTPHAAPARTTARRAAYANDDAVKIYGLTINVDENLSGIETPAATEAAIEGVYYTLDGRRGRSRGVNIVRLSDGTVRKVLVK